MGKSPGPWRTFGLRPATHPRYPDHLRPKWPPGDRQTERGPGIWEHAKPLSSVKSGSYRYSMDLGQPVSYRSEKQVSRGEKKQAGVNKNRVRGQTNIGPNGFIWILWIRSNLGLSHGMVDAEFCWFCFGKKRLFESWMKWGIVGYSSLLIFKQTHIHINKIAGSNYQLLWLAPYWPS